ncbi:negative elongation factor A [Bacillus rossius redtenbacheri]|uniref:negative elongation factor A n=1 Tax=Bacillus rossius redtenbacheri TaxID=93214 RepID=UPI002FDEF426
MAHARDSDTSLWLHNKLGTSNDSWTGGSICSQLNSEVLRNVKDCFPDLQPQVKLKLLLSFFHIPRRNVEEWRVELEEIVEIAQVDGDQWVSMLAEMMRTLPATGSLNTDVGAMEENKRIFSDLVNDLRKLVRKQSELTMWPMECHYLNKSALVSLVGQQSSATKHFTLKRKPKSAALRADLLQKSVDAANNLKKNIAPTVPVRSRGMPRKMTDTTPLKGIPSRPLGGGFKSSAPGGPGARPPLSRGPAGRKDGGIKLLDIAEQPLGYAQAKKRKRMQEMEETKRASEAAAAAQQQGQAAGAGGAAQGTPDYAAGLTAMNPPTPAPATPSYTPAPAAVATPAPAVAAVAPTPQPSEPATSQAVEAPATTAPSYVPLVVTATIQGPATQPVAQQAAVATTTTTASPVPAAAAAAAAPSLPKQVIQIRPAPPVTQIRLQPVGAAGANSGQHKGRLSLTREQMLEAQDMFRTANRVTRPEKALILGFMAGARDNPCPDLGNVVTIKLSENQENVLQADKTYLTMLVETHFQMNYNTGEWKRIRKLRKLDDPGGGPLPSIATLAAAAAAAAAATATATAT